MIGIKWPKGNSKNEFINICIIYRFIAITISTFVYLRTTPGDMTLSRMWVAGGMITACLIGAYIYWKSFSEQNYNQTNGAVIAAITLEIIAYGVLIVLSGGFTSPYLWYFISALLIVIMVDRYKIVFPISIAWCIFCAWLGHWYWYPGSSGIYNGVNIGIGFVVLAGGFYTLFLYLSKLDDKQKELNLMNAMLQQEVGRTEQALQHIMDIYDTFNIFAITDSDKILQELTNLLKRTIAPKGCMVIRIGEQKEARNINSSLEDLQLEAALMRYFSQHIITEDIASKLQESVGICTVTCITNHSNPAGLLIIPKGDSAENLYLSTEGVIRKYYLNLIGMILKNLDLQETAEEYIISEEQNRIASEIHDTTIQKLFAITCGLRLLDDQEGTSWEVIRQKFSEISQVAESTMRELREAIYGYRWDLEDKDFFVVKLTKYIDEVRHLTGTDIKLDIDENTQYLTINQKTAFYRSICEAVNNAIRHGGAAHVAVRVRLNEKDIVAEICDDGCGFKISPVHQAQGQGLKNINKMATLLRGHLIVNPEEGQGVTIKLSLPR